MRILLATSSFESFLKLIATLLVFVFVLLITYICSKWIVSYQKINMKSNNLQIIESIPAGNNKMICLVKAGIKYLVVSVGKEEIHLLTTLNEEDLTNLQFKEENTSGTGSTMNFSDLLEGLKDKLQKK